MLNLPYHTKKIVYGSSGVTTDMEIDRISQSVEQLDARGRELSWSLNNIEHGKERREAIQHELSSIALELWCKHRDGELEFHRV